ncbi:outer membrane beta-barrel protein [Endozoicomonas sp. SM1973]|uniref:Outer membrane beta-barrel protein n=1 Tax=Spartinivicinus marinus TaxID=2994442 RepID=A0A853I904_9GAMM|nr:outer membrane beta-barrel protein [Spartinivicinus marinus]MCX4025315.1 outer membrane beta-barrel protein [Spartinivicinus marinus]NYZ66037.1 outer membrane beta-barrel protein [Spartinivicinus marinus]
MKKTVLATIIASTVTAQAFAQDNINPFADEKSGLYLGIGAGKSSYDSAYESDTLNMFKNNSGQVNTNDSNGETIGKLFLGYRVNKYLALEAGYTDFNSSDADIKRSNTERRGARTINKNTVGKITNKIKGIEIKAIGLYPIGNKVDIKASAGIMRWKLDETYTGSTIQNVALGERSRTKTIFHKSKENKKGTSLTLGLGANYNITNNITVGLQWERIKDVGHKDLAFGETDIDTYTLSAQYNF